MVTSPNNAAGSCSDAGAGYVKPGGHQQLLRVTSREFKWQALFHSQGPPHHTLPMDNVMYCNPTRNISTNVNKPALVDFSRVATNHDQAGDGALNLLERLPRSRQQNAARMMYPNVPPGPSGSTDLPEQQVSSSTVPAPFNPVFWLLQCGASSSSDIPGIEMSRGSKFPGSPSSVSGKFVGGSMHDRGDLSSIIGADLMNRHNAGRFSQLSSLADEDSMILDVEHHESPWQPGRNGHSEPSTSSTSKSTEISHSEPRLLASSQNYHPREQHSFECNDTEMKWCDFMPTQEHMGSHNHPAVRSTSSIT